MLLRADPSNDAAQDLALTAVGAAITHGSVRIDAETESRADPDAVSNPLSLASRLQARRIDRIEVASGADLGELLALARALAHDSTPLRSSPNIRVKPLPEATQDDPDPPFSSSSAPGTADRRHRTDRRGGAERRRSLVPRWPGGDRRRVWDRRVSGERRLHLAKEVQGEAARLHDELRRAISGRAWEAAIHVALGVIRLTPRVTHVERGTFSLRAQQLFARPVIDEIIAVAERDPVVQAPAVDVLCWLGLPAAEAMLDRLISSPVLGPRAFLLEAAGRMPEAYRLVPPLLRSSYPLSIRYGALLAERLARPEAGALLIPHLDHPDEEIRVVVLQALGQLHHAPIADALRGALEHPSPGTRTAAAAAIARWRAGTLGLVLGAAAEREHDRVVWNALVEALGTIGSLSACTSLAAIASRHPSLVPSRGLSRDQRLIAVAALARTQTAVALETLRRLAQEADPDVRASAAGLLKH